MMRYKIAASLKCLAAAEMRVSDFQMLADSSSLTWASCQSSVDDSNSTREWRSVKQNVDGIDGDRDWD